MENGKILAKIISDAEARALELVSAAEKTSEAKAEAVKEQCQRQREERLNVLSAKGEENLKRREITARIDCNKLLLSARREVLDSVFDSALKKLCAAKEGEYLPFMEKLLSQHAEAGDEVVLSKACAYSDKIAALPVVAERGLKVRADGEFLGGAILIGSKCDKNLTFEALVQSAKEQLQAEIAAKLF